MTVAKTIPFTDECPFKNFIPNFLILNCNKRHKTSIKRIYSWSNLSCMPQLEEPSISFHRNVRNKVQAQSVKREISA